MYTKVLRRYRPNPRTTWLSWSLSPLSIVSPPSAAEAVFEFFLIRFVSSRHGGRRSKASCTCTVRDFSCILEVSQSTVLHRVQRVMYVCITLVLISWGEFFSFLFCLASQELRLREDLAAEVDMVQDNSGGHHGHT